MPKTKLNLANYVETLILFLQLQKLNLTRLYGKAHEALARSVDKTLWNKVITSKFIDTYSFVRK